MFSKSKQLTDVEKDKLWTDYISTHNIELRNKIIEEYAYLIKVIATKMSLYLGTNVEYEDLCSYGIFGLIDAIDKFDLNANVKFETYASVRIRGSILDNIRRMDWIPRMLRQRQRQIEEAKNKCRERGMCYPTDSDIAKELGVPVETYLEWETELLGTNIFSIEEDLENSDKDMVAGSSFSVLEQKVFESPEDFINKEELKKLLSESLQLLTDKERITIELIYYEDLTLKEIATILNISESRVSQLHNKALKKMQKKMGKYLFLFLST